MEAERLGQDNGWRLVALVVCLIAEGSRSVGLETGGMSRGMWVWRWRRQCSGGCRLLGVRVQKTESDGEAKPAGSKKMQPEMELGWLGRRLASTKIVRGGAAVGGWRSAQARYRRSRTVAARARLPAQGTPVPMKDYVMCKFPNDPTVTFGSLSVLSLLISAALGLLAVFFPYKGISVPKNALLHGMTMRVFFVVAALVTLFAEAMLMWVTITEGLHRTRNRHFDLNYECPTAKTGLFGGAAFLALDAPLFWLVCQMLTLNARADYLEEDDPKGTYGEALTTYYDSNAAQYT